MEKLQVLFPFSSSSELSATYPSSSSNNMANTHVFSSFQGDHFLGLKTQTYNHHQVQVPQLMVKDHQVNTTITGANDDQISARFAIGSSEKEEKVPMKIIKKGEKKVKKPKYAFQTRSQVDILDDGYRWRKYGQKAVKNNKFPRSYYRCTYQGCNVKKQVQRLTKDEGVVVTTYEGVHSHPIEKATDNFEHILSQMQIYTPF